MDCCRMQARCRRRACCRDVLHRRTEPRFRRIAWLPDRGFYRPNRREFAVVRPLFTTLLGGIHHSNRYLPPNSYLRTSDGNPLHRRATASQRASQRLSVKRGTESIERSPSASPALGSTTHSPRQKGLTQRDHANCNTNQNLRIVEQCRTQLYTPATSTGCLGTLWFSPAIRRRQLISFRRPTFALSRQGRACDPAVM